MELLGKVVQEHELDLQVAAAATDPDVLADRIRELTPAHADGLGGDALQWFHADLIEVFAPVACAWARTHVRDGGVRSTRLTHLLAQLELVAEQEAVARREEALGADHPDTLLGRNDLAVTYSSLGR